ncbi:hypothetical protein FGIG_12468 [Fasciola gigantica]|uniref:Uncharacterized protein n=1 Tax=Fasciola gigantica TaxID=46835 RepID=A0A504YU20_FASGI|nr:hypothetical protein FGIG_12468 [Fasciola gigantica]
MAMVTTEPRDPKRKKKSKPTKNIRNRRIARAWQIQLIRIERNSNLSGVFSSHDSDHPDPTPKPSSDWKSDDRLSSPVERSTVKPGPLTVDTTEHSLHPHQNQHISHLALSADTRDGHSHLSAGSTQAYTEDYHPSNRTESASRPQKSESFILKFPHEFDGLAEVEQDGETIITPQMATVEADGQPTSISTWYTSTKLEYPNSKLSEAYSIAQVSDDYLDSQSLAPHVSSSTVSPSSLGKFHSFVS